MEQGHKDALNYLKLRQDLMVEQLLQWVAINSGTDNQTGLSNMLDELYRAFSPLADEIQVISFPPIPTINLDGEEEKQQCGDALFIRKRPHLSRRFLLSGHMDTVYSPSHPFQTYQYLNDNMINGPGVADMKGGLVVILNALSAFEESPLAKELGWDVFINADEEIGSPASSEFLEKIAKNYQAALVYEPAMDETGTFAKNRSGSGKLTLIAHGKAAHAGRSFNEGRNAICYLSEAILAIHGLNGERPGVTINVGQIAGGQALNMVPDKAVAKLDIRIAKEEDERFVLDAIHSIINSLKREGFSLSISGHFGRPVKTVHRNTEKLFNRIKLLGEKYHLKIDWKNSGGCCDGNNLAKHGLAVLDTLGVRGGNIHSNDEFILLDSLQERAFLSLLIFLDLAQGGLEDINQ